MAELKVTSTASLVDEATVRAAGSPYRSAGVTPSTLGRECERAAWYDFRWCAPIGEKPANVLRIFRTGHHWEELILDDLEAAGFDVQRFDENGKQIAVRMVGGHLRGKLDGRIMGLPEASKTVHVVECKSHNLKSFEAMVKHGVQKGKPEHYVQCQIYMHATGDKRALYAAVCKDDDRYFYERIEYDPEFCMKLIAKAERIVESDKPLPKLHEDPNHRMAFACKFCDHRPHCHEDKFVRETNCRTCIHSTPVLDGKGSWHCTRFDHPLTWDEQREGCGAHLFIPGLIPGEITSMDEDAGTVTYKLRDGREWTDGNVTRS